MVNIRFIKKQNLEKNNICKSKKVIGKRAFSSIFLFIVFFTSGCDKGAVIQEIDTIDKKIGEVIEEFEKIDEKNDLKKNEEDKKDEENADNMDGKEVDSSQLTIKDKEKIDKWLEDNNLNRYGDKKDTFYSGGTPLFNEKTGESIDRYEYILKKHPNILK